MIPLKVQPKPKIHSNDVFEMNLRANVMIITNDIVQYISPNSYVYLKKYTRIIFKLEHQPKKPSIMCLFSIVRSKDYYYMIKNWELERSALEKPEIIEKL